MRLLLLALVSLTYLGYRLHLSYFVPMVWPDEVLFFNPASELFHNGVMRTSVLEGLIPGMESVTLWMPPLYMLGLSIWFNTGWIGIESGRFFSAILGLLTILTIQFHLLPNLSKWSFRKGNRFLWILPTLFIITDVLFINVSQTSRMETMCALFGVISIACIFKRYSFISGISLGLSFLSHPFAVFYAIPVTYLLVRNQSSRFWKDFTYILIGGSFPLMVWGVYVLPNWDIFLVQFGAQLERKKELLAHFGFLDRLRILIFHYPFSILQLIIILITPIFAIPAYRNLALRKWTYVYLVWFLSMGIGFYLSSESWYAIHLIFPTALLVYSMALDSDITNSLKNLKSGLQFNFRFLIIIFVCVVMVYHLYSIVWYYVSHSISENARLKTDNFFQIVESKASNHNTIYLQLIPDPYFHLSSVYPDKKLLEFIPGELPINHHDLLNTWNNIDLFLFYNDELKNPSLAEYLKNNPNYKRESYSIPYSSRVPGKGDWNIISYERINSQNQ